VASEKAIADATAGKTRAEAAAAAAARVKADTETRAKLATTAVRVGAIANPAKTKNVIPVYPPVAKSIRVGGTVHVEATIGPDGEVADARVVKSVPCLIRPRSTP